MASCVLEQVLGRSGYLSKTQSRIENLSLVTNSQCFHNGGQTIAVDLGGFKHLRALSWIGMCPGDLETLRCALTRCRSSLQSLELDLGNCFQEGPNEEEENMREVRQLFSEKLLGYSPSAMGVSFPSLRNLCLIDGHLAAAKNELYDALNFRSLQSLKLHHCWGAYTLLEHMALSGRPMSLRSPEIVSMSDRAGKIPTFLNSFQGFQEIYLLIGNYEGIMNYFSGHMHSQLWEAVLHHKETLKRIVFHQRTDSEIEDNDKKYRDYDGLEGSQMFHDLHNLMDRRGLRRLVKAVDPECFGICDAPSMVVRPDSILALPSKYFPVLETKILTARSCS
jgi:hypothetical protein